MPVIRIRVGGRDYQVACDKGEEDRLRELAEALDERVAALSFDMKKKPTEAMALLLAGLKMVDELHEKQAEDANPLPPADDELEQAMTTMLEEIAGRLERIADTIEIRS